MIDPAMIAGVSPEINNEIFYFGVEYGNDVMNAICDLSPSMAAIIRSMPPVPMSDETNRKLAELRTRIGALVKERNELNGPIEALGAGGSGLEGKLALTPITTTR